MSQSVGWATEPRTDLLGVLSKTPAGAVKLEILWLGNRRTTIVINLRLGNVLLC